MKTRAAYVSIVLAVAAAGCQVLYGIDDRVTTRFPEGDGSLEASIPEAGPIDDANASDATLSDADAADTRADATSTDVSVVAPDSGGTADASPLTCTAPHADCNAIASDGCEVDTSSDGKNCGRCHHDCLGGQCLTGVCQTFELASGQSLPTALAADDDTVYFTTLGTQSPALLSDGTVMAIPTHGGPPQILVSNLTSPHAIAIDDKRVYWSSDYSLTIEAADRFDGSGRTTILPVPDGGFQQPGGAHSTLRKQALLVFGQYIYWSVDGAGSGQVWRTFKDGQGSPELVGDKQQEPGSIAAIGTQVYWSNLFNDGGLEVVDFAAVTKTPYSLVSGSASCTLAANGLVYFVTGGSPTTNPTLWSYAPGTTNPSPLTHFGGGLTGCNGIAVDETNVYANFAPAFSPGEAAIIVAALDGGTSSTLLTSGAGYSLSPIVANRTAIYWASSKAGKIIGLAK